MEKYHIALSFAGEDRDYVEKVAMHLKENAVDVFYDRFEDTKLWGKDLYTHLAEIYKDRAIFTVIFVSKAYGDKLWTNHERKAAQARAFEESREYILPAIIDKDVEIPGLLKTTGFISISDMLPNEFSEKIIQKLQENGVILKSGTKFSYSDESTADIDFPLSKGSEVTKLIEAMKSYDWYRQNPAVNNVFKLNFGGVSSDELFVLGRNIYQCACGGERQANEIMQNLRRELAKVSLEVSENLLNGMFYEVYFNSKGNFRGQDLKGRHLNDLLALQEVSKYEDSIFFIRKALEPYRNNLAILPNSIPEKLEIHVLVEEKSPPMVISVQLKGNELITDTVEDLEGGNEMWKLSFKEFSLSVLERTLASAWHVPPSQLTLISVKKHGAETKFRLPKDKTIKHPSTV